MAKKKAQTKGNIGFEEKLWKMADKLRNNMDAAEYKHVVLGLIFLKYISDSFKERYQLLLDEGEGFEEDRDEYLAERVFWVPVEARWHHIMDKAKLPEIGEVIDDAMVLIEKENETLFGILPKNYGRSELDKTRLGELIDLISTIRVGGVHMSDDQDETSNQDILGRIYEYFLGKFASAEGKNGGEFYTPEAVVQLLVEMLEPSKGKIYDPCCGSGGMFVQSAKFMEAHQNEYDDLSIYGQESNPTTWKLCRMNLAIRHLDGNIGSSHGDTFHNDLHPDLRADYIMANPPFNIKDWGGDLLLEDARWQYGTPPTGNANYGWIQHMVHHLAPSGSAGFILANGSLSSNTSGEGDIRQRLIEADLIDCIVSLPGQLFYSTQIPVSMWFIRKNRTAPFNRSREILFIDARKMGIMESRVHRVLTPEEIKSVADCYHNWKQNKEYEDKAGFCKSASFDEVKEHDFILTPGRYVGIEEEEDDGIPFEEKMKGLTETLSEQFAASKELEVRIRENLKSIGFEVK